MLRITEQPVGPLLRAGIVIGVGLLTRCLILAMADPRQLLFDGDAAAYVAAAQAISGGHVPDTFRPPFYPLFLALTLPLGWWFPLAAQSALTIGTAMIAALRGRFLAGCLIAACPFLAVSDLRLNAESLYTNLVFLAWLTPGGVATGILLGAATLTRNTLLLLSPFALMLLRTRQWLIAAAVALVIAIPWLIIAGGAGGGLGLNLWIGTWERNGDWYLSGLDHPNFPPYAFSSPEEERTIRANWKNDEVLKRVAIDRIVHHPLQVVNTWVTRYPRLWLGTRTDTIEFRVPRHTAVWTLIKATFFSLNSLILAFGIWGALRPDRFVIPVIYVALFYVPFHNLETRYSIMALPFFIWLGCGRISQVIEMRRNRSSFDSNRPLQSA